MTIIAKQFGFSNSAGNVANLVDGNLSTSWRPLATDFASYPDQFFLADKTTLNYGKPFAALEFDLGTSKRVPAVFLKVETLLTLGPSVLIGSNVGATSPADTLQVGDTLLAEYTALQMCSNKFLDIPLMRDYDERRRFLRFLQRSNDPAVIAPTPGPANSVTYDLGSGNWEVVNYDSQLIIEVWGAGASGGVTSQAQNGAASTASNVSFSLTVNGGNKASQTVPNAGTGAGTGGTASGGNTSNITGGSGGVPSPTSATPGSSGKGGDAPNGGLGGDAVYHTLVTNWLGVLLGNNFAFGNDGRGPGGGGSGRSYWYPAGDVLFQKYPGGGSGGYSKHVIDRLSGDANPGSLIAWAVGNGGVSSQHDGKGAQGRVRFSWA